MKTFGNENEEKIINKGIFTYHKIVRTDNRAVNKENVIFLASD